MKTKSKIVLLLAGAAMSASASVAYAQNGGGNQQPAAEDNLLHLPQFREGSTRTLTEEGEFEFEVFSPYGMPSYIAVFARDTDFSINYKTQPMVTKLSIM